MGTSAVWGVELLCLAYVWVVVAGRSNLLDSLPLRRSQDGTYADTELEKYILPCLPRDEHGRLGCNLTQDGTLPYFKMMLVVRIRNEAESILEFILHHHQEGIRFFLIIDDRSDDNFLEELSCLKGIHFRVVKSLLAEETTGTKDASTTLQDLIVTPKSFPGSQFLTNQVQDYNYYLERYGGCAEWVGFIDTDEFLVSRRRTKRTTVQVLENELSKCSIVYPPWLMYTWGDQSADYIQKHGVRKGMVWRWSFEKRPKGRPPPGFGHVARDISSSVRVKVLCRTEFICRLDNVHVATLLPNAPLDPCVVEPEVGCASEVAHCLVNRSRSKPGNSKVKEKDVPLLPLALHHYRIRSAEHLAVKMDPNSTNRYLYKGNISSTLTEMFNTTVDRFVNRKDVLDPFMGNKRRMILPTPRLYTCDECGSERCAERVKAIW